MSGPPKIIAINFLSDSGFWSCMLLTIAFKLPFKLGLYFGCFSRSVFEYTQQMYSWELLKCYFTLSSTRQSSFLTCGCFCVRGPIHHKPFQNITAKPATFAREKDSHNTTPGTSCPTLFEQCDGSLTLPVDILNMEGSVRQGLRFIVLIREDLKV